jgi:hypothetical protein
MAAGPHVMTLPQVETFVHGRDLPSCLQAFRMGDAAARRGSAPTIRS